MPLAVFDDEVIVVSSSAGGSTGGNAGCSEPNGGSWVGVGKRVEGQTVVGLVVAAGIDVEGVVHIESVVECVVVWVVMWWWWWELSVCFCGTCQNLFW